ncbi:hypothetical protein FHR92_005373 [Fontibacillus solani]|uniref:Uncharacterized protein n=1 Tax=Fontibacillus solani TaxID=1572857 RepID=A0A7W3SZ49_9BACL|nr:hypothetical protein [Fontibacillus solani]MBA9088828.1 hypothetical protein [Fontibacillus solani]
MEGLQELRELVLAKLTAEEQTGIESDPEYYLIYGQLVFHVCTKVNPHLTAKAWREKFDSARTSETQKEVMRRFMTDRGDLINLDNTKLKRALSMFYGYVPDTAINQGDSQTAYLYGFTAQTVL